MKIIITLSLYFSIFSLYAQSDVFEYSEHKFSPITDIEEVSINKNILALVNYRNIGDSYLENKSKLVLFNKEFKKIKSLELDNPNIVFSEFYRIKNLEISNSSKNIYLVSGWGTDQSLAKGKGYLLNYLIDENLNIIDKAINDVDSANFIGDIGYSDILGDSLIIFYSQTYQYQGIQKPHADVVLNIKTLKFETYRTKNEDDYVYNSYLCPYEKKVKYLNVVIYDQNGFSYSSDNINAISSLRAQVFVVKDSTYLIGSRINSRAMTGSGVKIAKIDNKLNVIKYYASYDSESAGTYQLASSYASLNKDSSAFYTANIDINSTIFQDFVDLSFIDIMKVGLDMKEKWRVRFAKDESERRLRGYSIKTSEDNGVLLCGWMINDFQNLSTGFILRLDKDGNIVKTVGIDEKELSYVKSYPNPTSGLFKIELTNMNASIVKVFAMDGRQMMVQEIPKSSTMELDLSYLPSGTYIYNLYNKDGKILASDKVVKE